MNDLFAITSATNHIILNEQRQGEVTVTVTNRTSRPVRGRATIVPLQGAIAGWFTLEEGAERHFAPAGTQQYVIQIHPPTDAPAGSALFRLDMVGIANPDEEFGEGPTITFETPPPAAKKKAFPWWLVVVAVALVGLCGLLLVILVASNNNDNGPVTMEVELTTGADGTADNLQFSLDGSFEATPFTITLDNPNDLRPFQTDSYTFEVPAGLCQLRSFELVKFSRLLILERWDLQTITIAVDGEEIFSQQPAASVATNQRVNGDLTQSPAFQERCGN